MALTCQESINLPLTYTTMWVQQIKFIFHPISPPLQRQAANLGWAVCSNSFWNISKSGMCMLGHLPAPIFYQSLFSHLLPSRGAPEKPIFKFHSSRPEVPPWGQWAFGINYLLCLRDTGGPVQGSHDQWVFIHFNHFLWKELLSWRAGSVMRNLKDILWLLLREKRNKDKRSMWDEAISTSWTRGKTDAWFWCRPWIRISIPYPPGYWFFNSSPFL